MPWEDTKDYIRSGHGAVPEGGTCRTITIKGITGVKAITCKPASGGSMDIQSFLFKKSDGWTMEKAKAWFKSHRNIIEGSMNKRIEFNSITLDHNEIKRVDNGNSVTYKHVCITKEGVMNNAFKPRDDIEKLYNYLVEYNITIPFTDGHPHPVVSDWPEVIGVVGNWDLNTDTYQLYGDITIPKSQEEHISRIDDKTNSDVSLGYWTEDEFTSGTFHDDIANEDYEYDHIEHDLFPNHIANLEAGLGACSTKHGCGIASIANKLEYILNREAVLNMIRDAEDCQCQAPVGALAKKGESMTKDKLKENEMECLECGTHTVIGSNCSVCNAVAVKPEEPEPPAVPEPPADSDGAGAEPPVNVGGDTPPDVEPPELETPANEPVSEPPEPPEPESNLDAEVIKRIDELESKLNKTYAILEKIAVKNILEESGVDLEEVDTTDMTIEDVNAFIKVNHKLPKVKANSIPKEQPGPITDVQKPEPSIFRNAPGNWIPDEKGGHWEGDE